MIVFWEQYIAVIIKIITFKRLNYFKVLKIRKVFTVTKKLHDLVAFKY